MTQQSGEAGNSIPTMDSLSLSESSRGRQITSLTPNEGSPKTLYVYGSASDANGCSDIQSIDLVVYRSGVGPSCASDMNDCYRAILGPSDFDAGCQVGIYSVTFQKAIALANFVDPTDSGAYLSQDWVAKATVNDPTDSSSLDAHFEILSLAAFGLDSAYLSFGTLSFGAVSTQQSLVFSNTGNYAVDAMVLASSAHSGDLVSDSDPSSYLAASSTHYSLTPGFSFPGGIPVSGLTASGLPLSLAHQTADSVVPSSTTYWKLSTPNTPLHGTYRNSLVFTAVPHESSLLPDGDMEAVGTAAWTASAATLTKGTDSPAAGSRYLRVASTGSNWAYATQNALAYSHSYHVSGYVRSDGSKLPEVWFGNNLAYRGTASTAWQYFDVTATTTASSKTIFLGVYLQTGGYTDYDQIMIQDLGPLNLVVDGDMESSDTSAWIADAATLSKETVSPAAGRKNLRVTSTGSNWAYAKQNVLTSGHGYHVRGYVRSDGTKLPEVWLQGALAFRGTSSTSWQSFDSYATSTGATLFLGVYLQTGGYTEYDGLTIEDVTP